MPPASSAGCCPEGLPLSQGAAHPLYIRKGRKQRQHGRQNSRGKGCHGLEGQVFLSYSSHNVNVPVAGARHAWALFCKPHFKLTLPHLSSGLILVHFTLGPKLLTPAPLPPPPEAWQRCDLSNSPLCRLPWPSPTPHSPALWPLHLIAYLLLPDDFRSCSRNQFQVT